MKTNSKIILISVLSALILAGCNKETEIIDKIETALSAVSEQQSGGTEKKIIETEGDTQYILGGETEASAATAETAKAAESETESGTADTEPQIPEKEDYLIGFLSYLQNKGFAEDETNYFSFEQGEDFGEYDFMDDFTLDSYSYSLRDDGLYDVTLTCSESACDMFPNGNSYWVYGRGFYPAERENDITFPGDMDDADEPLKTAFFAAESFTLASGEFEADEDRLANYSGANIHSFYHAYNPYMEKDETGGVYPEEYIRAVKKLYNIDIPEDSFDYLYEDDPIDDVKAFSLCYHGASWLYDTFAGYEETDSEIKVLVDYYGDSMYFYPVIESEYTFSKNDDGTITLQKVEKIFDNGYSYASGTV